MKWVLWFFAGAAAVVALFRFINGLGATTALTDSTPWGLWIGFDVMGGVALAAGGFLMAASVYVFRLERYRPFVRPAVLTAFLGYLAVAVGLVFDLGVPYNIWRLTINWQHHSALFEVGWCVMLYLTVLLLEFAPVVLEKTPFSKVVKLLKKAAPVLVILGIMLSTLHQSSLGTLMVLMPARVHPLWYSPILPFLFLISAIALGLMMVTTESLVTGYLYEHKHDIKPLSGLGRAASFVLVFYLLVRLGDLGYRGHLGLVTDGSWESILFLTEISISTVLPAILLFIPAVRASRAGLSVAAFLVIFGFLLNRIDASGVSTIWATGEAYFPSLAEFIVSIGIVSATVLVFFFFTEHFNVYEPEHKEPEEGEDEEEPATPSRAFDSAAIGFRRELFFTDTFRRYSLPFVLAAAISFALMPEEAIYGAVPEPTPVRSARGAGDLLIDGDRAGMIVSFNHDEHVEREGGDESCASCHHMNAPLDQATPCAQCHRDMYLETNIFEHDLHVEHLGGNQACIRCHEAGQPHSAGASNTCNDCHEGMREAETGVEISEGTRENYAVGYREAMHGLCIHCHEERAPTVDREDLHRCATCHRDLDEQVQQQVQQLYSQSE